MSRRRYLSTEVSLDSRINRLAIEAGDFAALCYTWMIPHAEDDATITADPEELLFRVFPGRRDKSSEDIAAVIARMVDLQLLIREDRRLSFPPEAFYRYQSYIPADKRRTAKNAEDQRQSANKAVSPSPSPSPSPKEDKETPSGDIVLVFSKINELSGKNYKPEGKTSKGLKARIKEGASLTDCLRVVEDRWHRWRDKPDMLEHFNPSTIFRPENFEKYLTEANAASLNGSRSYKFENDLMPE